MASDTAEELERFRQRWQEEVSTRKKPTGATASSSRSKSKQPNDTLPPPLKDRPHLQPDRSLKEARTELEGRDLGYHDLENKDDALRLGESGSGIRSKPRPEPQSALEHYERAVERESEGSLGESLSLYRKAYRVCDLHFSYIRERILIVLNSLMLPLTRLIKTNTFRKYPPLRSHNQACLSNQILLKRLPRNQTMTLPSQVFQFQI